MGQSKKTFIYEFDAAHKRLAISLNGKVYHGGYDDVLSEDDYSIQQYTAMKDKDGKDIYEGDILEWGMSLDDTPSQRLRFVEFHELQLIWKVVDVGELPASVSYLYEAKQPSTRWCRVVGNIFENPELLKNEK